MARIVCIDYTSLSQGNDISQQIFEGFGPSGIGILTVSGVPNFVESREKLLQLSRRLALLPQDQLSQIAGNAGLMGWSAGTEKFLGVLDNAKASFESYPYEGINAENNRWPEQLPELKQAVIDMSMIIKEVGLILAQHLDQYIKSFHSDYPGSELQNIVSQGNYHVSRLLHYYPQTQSNNWCGWHNDHCALTGLVPEMYLNQETGEIIPVEEVRNNETGLFFIQRDGSEIKGDIPIDHLAFQIGEVAQIISGGKLQATPHAVKSNLGSPTISRQSFAVFLEPDPDYNMNVYGNPEEVYVENQRVPSLRGRWVSGMRFHDFHISTISNYY